MPLWLWFIIFAIVIVVGAVVVWYLQKLVWYLFSKSQEKEFDEQKGVSR